MRQAYMDLAKEKKIPNPLNKRVQKVIDRIENIMILQYNTGNWPLEVITGNSQKMKSLVIKHAYSRGFNTKAPVNDNPGSIIVF